MTGRTCSVESCDRDHAAKGLCLAHYQAQQRGHDPHTWQPRPQVGPGRMCAECGKRRDNRGDDGGKAICATCRWLMLRREDDERPMTFLDQTGPGQFRCVTCATAVATADVFGHRCCRVAS